MGRIVLSVKVGGGEAIEEIVYCADRWLLGESKESLKAAYQKAVKLRSAEDKMSPRCQSYRSYDRSPTGER